MDIDQHICIDVLNIMADDDAITKRQSSQLRREIARLCYQHAVFCWRFSDLPIEFEVPAQFGTTFCSIGAEVRLVRRKYHLKFIHKEMKPTILGLTIANTNAQMARTTSFCSTVFAVPTSFPGFPSMVNVAPRPVVIPPPVTCWRSPFFRRTFKTADLLEENMLWSLLKN